MVLMLKDGKLGLAKRIWCQNMGIRVAIPDIGDFDWLCFFKKSSMLSFVSKTTDPNKTDKDFAVKNGASITGICVNKKGLIALRHTSGIDFISKVSGKAILSINASGFPKAQNTIKSTREGELIYLDVNKSANLITARAISFT
jgi:hypothetical protein